MPFAPRSFLMLLWLAEDGIIEKSEALMVARGDLGSPSWEN